MGLEVAENKPAKVSVEKGSIDEQENKKKSQGQGSNEAIKFGSHGLDEKAKGEAQNVLDASFPKDAVDEWPAPKLTHSFYFVKYRSYDDPKLKPKLEQADKELQKKIHARDQIIEKLRQTRSERQQIITQMKPLKVENMQFREILDEKRKELEPLQKALGKFRGVGLCSSEEELDNLIKSLQYRIQHESIPLNEEKQILREMKQLEGTRDKVIANSASRAKIQESMGEKESIQDQVKHMGVDLKGVKKEHQVVKFKRDQLKAKKVAQEKHILSLEAELKVMTEKRDEARRYCQEVRRQKEEGNICYYQNRTLLNMAKAVAAKKDVEALKHICDTEVEKFMSQWGSSKAFRDDYEKRISLSLDMRQLSRDGRIRNPDEKPLVLFEAKTPSKTEAVAKTNVKRSKEDPISPPQNESPPVVKVPKQTNSKPQKKLKNIPTGSATTLDPPDLEDKEIVFGLEKPQRDALPKVNEVDARKLKEMKREEELEKAKQAMARKKKLAEKAAVKAAIRAQKEAEKKLKDSERKAKKKAASLPGPEHEEPNAEADAEVVEAEKVNGNVEAPVPAKNKDRNEGVIRHRSRPKGPESISKVILKRKKANNYWMWAAPAAILVLMLLAFGYNYLPQESQI